MQLSVQTIGLARYPIEEALKILQRLGVDGVEFVSSHLPYTSPGNWRDCRQLCAEHGLKVVGIVADSTGFTPYAEDPSSAVACLRRNIENCAGIGGQFVMTGEGRKPSDLDFDTAWRRLVRVFAEAARIAEANGVTIVNEYHPGFTASTIELAPKLVDDVGSPAFLGCVDFWHADRSANGDVLGFIRAMKGRMGNVHIADGDTTPIVHTAIGEGTVDVAACIQAVKETGYQGNWSLDVFGLNFPVRGLEVSVPRVRAMLG